MGLTKPSTSQLKASGDSGSRLRVQDNRSIGTRGSDEDAISEITGGSFDSSQGILTLEFANAAPIKIANFPCLKDIKEGKQGKQGDRGEDGDAGKDGENGKNGESGCEGEEGEEGKQGVTGPTGAIGPIGETGPTGATGAEGKQGKRGPTGATGAMGKRGPTGAAGTQGKQGEMGPPGKINIIISTYDPGPKAKAGALWVNPKISNPSSYNLQWP